MVVGELGAAVATYLAISTIIGLPAWVVIFVGPAFVIIAMIKLNRRPAAEAARKRRVKITPAKSIADRTGESLKIGDTVRAGTGFDGPMELTFGRGVVVKVGRGRHMSASTTSPSRFIRSHQALCGGSRRP